MCSGPISVFEALEQGWNPRWGWAASIWVPMLGSSILSFFGGIPCWLRSCHSPKSFNIVPPLRNESMCSCMHACIAWSYVNACECPVCRSRNACLKLSILVTATSESQHATCTFTNPNPLPWVPSWTWKCTVKGRPAFACACVSLLIPWKSKYHVIYSSSTGFLIVYGLHFNGGKLSHDTTSMACWYSIQMTPVIISWRTTIVGRTNSLNNQVQHALIQRVYVDCCLWLA